LGLLAKIHTLYHVFGFAFTIEDDFLSVFHNDTEKFSFDLEVVDSNPVIRMILFGRLFSVIVHPVELIDKKTNFLNEIHFGTNLPSDIFGEFKQDFFRVDATRAIVFFFLRVVEKLGLMT
jgi:hypothetical protein